MSNSTSDRFSSADAVPRRSMLKTMIAASVLAAAGSLIAMAPVSGYAQAYPTQPIRFIVPFAPGGGVDVIARTIGEAITKQSGHTVVVENRTGAGGNVASLFVARSNPDGYTVLVGSNSNSYNDFLYSDIGYNPAKDLRRVVQIGRVPMVLLVSPTIEPKTVQEVVALAKSKPGALNFGSGGNGTAEHLVYELFKRRTDIEATHVPYRGGAQVYTDLMSGVIQLMFNNQLGAMPHIRSGQLRAVGMAGKARSPQLPDLPTFAEQGIPDFEAAVWWGLMVPAGTPDAAVAGLNRIVNAALGSEEVKNRLQSLGAEPVGGPPEQFESFFAAERSRWESVIKAAGIKLE
jgi:tripartite-type tricarboxylate transporter receptor subunit TctC